jgi:hypothetical protein
MSSVEQTSRFSIMHSIIFGAIAITLVILKQDISTWIGIKPVVVSWFALLTLAFAAALKSAPDA